MNSINENKIDKNELKKIQLQILDDVSSFCEKNNINYFLTCGTLIGAVRHNGYIPWDDDIDIGMLREDYDKFIKLYNCDNNRYELKCYEKDHKYCYPFGKVYDTKTILYEPNINGVKSSVFIDVFVYDKAPNNKIQLKKMYWKRDIYNYLRLYQKFVNPNNKSLKNFIKKILVLFLSFFPENYFVGKMIKNSKTYSNTNNKMIGNFLATSKIYVEENKVKHLIKKKFEDKTYNIPQYYDEWLKQFYGDYMTLPPEEKRVSPHSFVAYYLDGEQNENNNK